MYPSINIPATNIPAVNIPAVTGKIYIIIENLTDIIGELNKAPLSAQICNVEGAGTGLERDEGAGSRDEGASLKDEGAGGSRDEKYGPDGPPKSLAGKDVNLFRYLSGNEGLELIRLESTRQSLLRAQGFLEERKDALIGLAKSRQK
jgi:hypothetical protein